MLRVIFNKPALAAPSTNVSGLAVNSKVGPSLSLTVILSETEPAEEEGALQLQEFTKIAAVIFTSLSPSTNVLSITPMVNVFSFSPAANEMDGGNINVPGMLADKFTVKAIGLLPAVRRSVACVAKKPAASEIILV